MQCAGGVNRYFAELIDRLPEGTGAWLYGAAPQPPGAPGRSMRRLPPIPQIAGPVVQALAQWCRVFHPTYYHLTPPLAYQSIKSAVVVTVHDFIIDRYRHKYERSAKLLAAQREAIERADALLCVSQSTLADLLERHPDRAGSAIVTYLGCRPRAVPAEHIILDSCIAPIFLYVGSRSFYKNFDWTVLAIAELRRRGILARLKVVGPPWSRAEQSLLHSTACADWLSLEEHPEDDRLDSLYRSSTALIYPSDYEGFGLPPLEAMACGCPVVAQKTSSLPEVLGDAGVWFNPGTSGPRFLADALHALCENPASVAQARRLGLQQADRFRWEETARLTLGVYESLA